MSQKGFLSIHATYYQMAADFSRIDILTFVLIAAIVVAAAVAFWPLVDVIILALSLAVVVLPLHWWFCRYMRAEFAAALTTTLIFLAVLVAVVFTVAVIYQNSDYLLEIGSTILSWINAAPAGDGALGTIPSGAIAEWLTGLVGNVDAYLADLVSAVPMLVVKIIVFFLALFMFIYKGDDIRLEIMEHLPGRVRRSIHVMTETTVNTLYAIYVVHVATAVITFILAIPFFYFLGFDHILFYAVIAAIFQLIPIIGPSLVMLFLGIYALSIGDYRAVLLIVFIGYPVVCAFPDIYLRPMFMGQRAAIHPILMWIGFFGGLAVMGIIGFVLGPMFIALIISGYKILLEQLHGDDGDDKGGGGSGGGGGELDEPDPPPATATRRPPGPPMPAEPG